MEILLNSLLELSLHAWTTARNPIIFNCLSNVSRLSMITYELEHIINIMGLQVRSELATFSKALSDTTKSNQLSRKPSTDSLADVPLPTDTSLRNSYPQLSKEKMAIVNKVDYLMNSNEFPLHSVGKYSPKQRLKRILTFKIKKILKRQAKPVSRRFVGRSCVAKRKLRFRGRFVKKDTQVKKTLFKVIHSKARRRILGY